MDDNSPLNPAKPAWLRRRALSVEDWQQMKSMLDQLSLATICEEADCPNIGECFHSGTATFLILGRVCTRNCRFCAVQHGRPLPPDPQEPHRLVEAVRHLGLRHAVITSVTRDDLPDGGATHFAACVRAIHQSTPATVEVLVPDFAGNDDDLQTVVLSQPEVFGHNLEVVPRLYPQMRPGADYQRSLRLLQQVKQQDALSYTKSSLMVGVGETEEEVVAVMEDLRAVGCDFMTVGQYLRPSQQHHAVIEYVTPGTFEQYDHVARELGFLGVQCGPFVRSSYGAGAMLEEARKARRT